MDNVAVLDDLDTRILGMVKREPGIRFSDISRELNIPPSTAYGRIMRLRRFGDLRVDKGVQCLEIHIVEREDDDRE